VPLVMVQQQCRRLSAHSRRRLLPLPTPAWVARALQLRLLSWHRVCVTMVPVPPAMSLESKYLLTEMADRCLLLVSQRRFQRRCPNI
jgi:hypothetical protein